MTTRLPVGSTAWLTEEHGSALRFAAAEADEFAFAVRNEALWLNEHVASVFRGDAEVNVAELFKTPGKLRAKTPRANHGIARMDKGAAAARVPLSNVFSSTPKAFASPVKHAAIEKLPPPFRVAEDAPREPTAQETSNAALPAQLNPLDSGYFGSQATQAVVHRDVSSRHESDLKRGAQERLHDDDDDAHDMDVDDPRADEDVNVEILGQSDSEAEPELDDFSERATEAKTINTPHHDASPSTVLPIPASTSKPSALPDFVKDIPAQDTQTSPSPSSEGSSPLRPVLRKSSLNFASLPAREPLKAKQSMGARVSRVSHLDRTSHFGRQPGEKSLGGKSDADSDDDVDTDEPDAPVAVHKDADATIARMHNKTSTQRLQDQISKLGQSQSFRPPTKSISNVLSTAQTTDSAPQVKVDVLAKDAQEKSAIAPGAFPSEEDDSWIGPASGTPSKPVVASPRPVMVKSHTVDVMQGLYGKDAEETSELSIAKRGTDSRRSPVRDGPLADPAVAGHHTKSISTSVLPSPSKIDEAVATSKTISVSNPNPVLDSPVRPASPVKSPSRTYKTSPLKAAKDKFSSILKTSKGLFASSAAVSAEAKTSALSTTLPMAMAQSQPRLDLFSSPGKSRRIEPAAQSQPETSPSRSEVRKTQASLEKEKKQQRVADDQAALVQDRNMADKLEQARLKVEEEARVHRAEQERVAAMQKQVAVARKEVETHNETSGTNDAKPTRSSPRKVKGPVEVETQTGAVAKDAVSQDTEMHDAPASMPMPARPKSQIGRPIVKRPVKPSREMSIKSKPPTVIRVDTTSQRGHQYAASTATLTANVPEYMSHPTAAAPSTLRHKASNSSISSKASTSVFKSAASKALEAAARKKEQDELVAQRKREVKAEHDRQRAAAKEEERRQQELQRQREIIRQRELQKEKEAALALAESKKAAARQAAEKRRLELEKAKQTTAPPPATRPDGTGQDRALPSAPRELPKVPRAAASMPRGGEDIVRPSSALHHHAPKLAAKRTLANEDEQQQARPGLQRNPASYKVNENGSKRRKTSEEFVAEELLEDRPKLNAPPVRQSGFRPKDIAAKSLFPSGYANAPPSTTTLQRSALLTQHNLNQVKPSHPMDMAQISKAPIAFASTQQNGAPTHKTPARLGAAAPNRPNAQSAAKSSPRYLNGDNIDLPEIDTDEEDDDDEDDDYDDGPKKSKTSNFVALSWTDSPELRRAIFQQDKTLEPSQVFGPPAPFNMEEVFSKSKDRFKKFRDRTSSANWSGCDRLTEEEVRRDLEGRDRVRRQGGWTYEGMV